MNRETVNNERTMIIEAIKKLENKLCCVEITSGSVIKEMSLINSVVTYDEKCNSMDIYNGFADLSLDIDECLNAETLNGNLTYFNFANGIEIEITDFENSELEAGIISTSNDNVIQNKFDSDPREKIVNKIMMDFGIEIPLLAWSGMEIEELEEYYEELKNNQK